MDRTALPRSLKLPITYLCICEVLAVVYEIGLALNEGFGYSIVAAILLVVLTVPITGTVGADLKLLVANALGYTDGIMINSFWPREVSLQAAIFLCFAVLWGVMYLFSGRRE